MVDILSNLSMGLHVAIQPFNLFVAMVGLVQVIPVVLLFVWSGALVDRSDRRLLTTIAATGTGRGGAGGTAPAAMRSVQSANIASPRARPRLLTIRLMKP